jgi:hypothetical protein
VTDQNLATASARKSDDIVIAEWPVSKHKILRVAIRTYKSRVYIDARRWHRDVDGNWCAGRGLILSLGRPLLARLKYQHGRW